MINHFFILSLAQSVTQSSSGDYIAGFKLNKIESINKISNVNVDKNRREVQEISSLQFLQPAKVITKTNSYNQKTDVGVSRQNFNSTSARLIENSMLNKAQIPKQHTSSLPVSNNTVKPIAPKLQAVIPEQKESVNVPQVKPADVAAENQVNADVEPQNNEYYSNKFDKLPKELEKAKEVTPPSYFSMVMSLFVVLILIFIFGWAYNRLKDINPALLLAGKQYDKKANRFNLISTASLGQGKSIHLVEINGKRLILGSTANSVNLLSELPEEFKSAENFDIKETGKQPAESQDTAMADAEHYENGYSDLYKEYINQNDKQV